MKLKKEHLKLKTEERLYQTKVPVIGLTGGIATGKSTVSDILRSEGFSVIDADLLVKDIYKMKSTIDFIKQKYPEVINDEKIDFSKLREKFFTDKAVKFEIETLIYSKLPEAWATEVVKHKDSAVLFYDVPLLFEKSLENLFDITVLVYAPREVQKVRLIERDEISDELAEGILNHQMNIEEKKKKADFIIDNDGDIEKLGSEVENLLTRILY
jgi:dephospho-CoA kinase